MKIALLGYGKMGKAIEAVVEERGHDVVLRAGRDTDLSDLSKADVAIEFSTPEAAVENLRRCFDKGVPVICGTTGWLERYDEVAKNCKDRDGGLLYASNFSIGVNLFFELNRKLAVLMANQAGYEVSVEETHHTGKKDAPSGTAISLAEDIIANSAYTGWKLNTGNNREIPITAKRITDVKGTHIIRYGSDIDTIEIKHEAHTRKGFALGAVLAAEWLQGKKGIYSMKDVLLTH